MTKIIKLDGEDVILGTDDGKIRKVRIYDIHFAPAVGDEVEIYEGDGEIIITKKEVPNEKKNDYIDQTDYYHPQCGNTNVLLVFLYTTLITSIVACFLPVFSVSFLGLSYSVNYVYNDGNIADGIFIVGIQIIAIILLFCKKRTAVCILELLTIPVLVYTVYNLSINIPSSVNVSIYNLLGTGFYILAISLLASVILSSIYAIKN